MANEEHVAQLRNGVLSWNAWRKQNPDIHPDLREANLRGKRLRRANLSETCLDGADLREAELIKANLIKADLFRAQLRGAELREAKLIEANLFKTDLDGANLTGADLDGG
jgi:uncharacterized protein YjbI with pentapeptide repeats